MNGSCKPRLRAPDYVTKILQAKIGKKLTNLNRNISVNPGIEEKWFVVLSTLSTTFLLVMFVYPNLILVLHFFLTFFFFFFFPLPLSTFKPLNAALYLKFERLKISGRTLVQQKSRVPGWWIPLNRNLQNFELLNRSSQMD